MMDGPGHPEGADRRDHLLWAELARQHYRSRRLRGKIFGSESLFGEPAWDILLDLFIANKEQRKVSVMSACIGSAVPSTTALRWIAALERENLIVREDDPDDARRTYVVLTQEGDAAMSEYFDASSKAIKGAAMLMARQVEQANANGMNGSAKREDVVPNLPVDVIDPQRDSRDPHKLRA
jgi:DNA-binding MarR family transcriptional regulator